jgi:Zn-dependent protease with chaperone function
VSPRYENPAQPEQVEARDGHPLAEVAILVGAVISIGAILVAVLAFGATWLAPKVPFRLEQQFALGFFKERPVGHGSIHEQALRGLAERLVREMDLPAGVSVTIHYDEGPVINAFATLGGHIVVYRGLIDRMPNEDALAAVIAHEIAHVKHRHPAASLGRGVAIGLVLSMIGITSGSTLADRVIGAAPNLTLLKFSRDQETEADAEALRAIGRLYGHVGGIEDLFRVFQESRKDPPRGAQFLLTHPITGERLRQVASAAAREGWASTGERTPLAVSLLPQLGARQPDGPKARQ